MEGEKESMLTGYPNVISFECTLNLLNQMKKDICKFKIGNNQGTGFFCKIPFPNKENMLPVFITNNHLIGEDLLNDEDEKIYIKTKENNEMKNISFNNRMKYTNKEYDVTIIEIKEKNEIDDYMELDERILKDIIDNKNENVDYIDETIYIIQYPEGKLSVSYGILNEIYEDKKYNFLHKCCTKGGSSGSPILNTNNKIIGIHKEGNISNSNEGTFLNYPIKDFIKQNYKNNQTNNRKPIDNDNKNKIKVDRAYNLFDDSYYTCPLCKNVYDKNKHIPLILDCVDTICSSCINYYKEVIEKGKFECPKCDRITHSLNIENKNAYPNYSRKDNQPYKNEEFEIYIEFLSNQRDSIIVTKSMTVGQLYDKIQRDKGYNKDKFRLTLQRLLNDYSRTIESYGITQPVVLKQISY